MQIKFILLSKLFTYSYKAGFCRKFCAGDLASGLRAGVARNRLRVTLSEKVRRLVSEREPLESIPREQPKFPTMGMPRRIAVKGMQGVDATVVVTVVRGTVWLSISPPFTWEAIMKPGKVDEVIHVLELARDEVTKAAAASNGSTPRTGNVVRAIAKKRD